MTDVMTPEQRSRCMAAIRGKDTKPEMIVRKYLFSRGLRFRVNSRKLPGSPDIVFRKYKTVVFIDGCFWHGHGHEGCRYFRLPKSNVEFWKNKIERNIARDSDNNSDLMLAGWKVLRVWECDIRTKARREETLKNLYDSITGRQLCGHYQIESICLRDGAEWNKIKASRLGEALFVRWVPSVGKQLPVFFNRGVRRP